MKSLAYRIILNSVRSQLQSKYILTEKQVNGACKVPRWFKKGLQYGL